MLKLKTYFIFACVGLLFFGCKKYPENTLWFKKPEKVFKGGVITVFTENSVDKIPYFRELYSTFPYNYYGHAIPDVYAIPFEYNSSNGEFKTEYGSGTFLFSETKREVEIDFKPINADSGAENIFMFRMSWKVIKLTKNGQLKLEGKYNFKLYELQFN